jgi:hypothetical protein
MSFEELLRDELSRSAESVSTDTGAAFDHVIETARSRQRSRRVTLAVGVVAVVVAGVLGITHTDLPSQRHSPGPATRTTRPTQPAGPGSGGHAYTRTRIFGEWQTRIFPTRQVRAAMTSAGVSEQDADSVLAGARTWRVQANFSEGVGGPVVVFTTWDPRHAATSLRISDEYPYTTDPRSHLVLTPVSSSSRWVFSYRISGDRLHLQLLSATPRLTGHAKALVIAWTTTPFTLVH